MSTTKITSTSNPRTGCLIPASLHPSVLQKQIDVLTPSNLTFWQVSARAATPAAHFLIFKFLFFKTVRMKHVKTKRACLR